MNKKLKLLVIKYNDVLKESMQIAIAEDLINLIIVNGDDIEFDLKVEIENKSNFKSQVFKEFVRNNTVSVLKDLGSMEEIKLFLNKQTKLEL